MIGGDDGPIPILTVFSKEVEKCPICRLRLLDGAGENLEMGLSTDAGIWYTVFGIFLPRKTAEKGKIMGKNAEYIQRVMGYVEENVPVIQSILADRKDLCNEFLKNVQGKELDKILLFGIGSSYNAGLMVKPLLESALQMDVLVASPAMYEQLCRSRSFDNALLIAASQSGKSAATIDVVKELKAKGAFVVGLTGNLESPLAKESSAAVDIHCGEEKSSVMTKGVLATAMMMAMIGLEYGAASGRVSQKDYDKIMADFNFIASHMQENLSLTKEWCAANVKDWSQYRSFSLISNIDSTGTTLEIALKVMESIFLPSDSFEVEEYLHGPHLLLSRKEAALLQLDSVSMDHEKLSRIHSFLREKNAPSYQITQEGVPGFTKDSLKICSVQNGLLDFAEFLPVLQVWSISLWEYFDQHGLDEFEMPGDLSGALATKVK